MTDQNSTFKYPGTRAALDGNTAVIMCERESTDGAGAYPITPSTQMGEYWAEAAAAGHINVSGRPLIFIEPEGEHAAAAVTAGLSMTGLRAANFSSGQGIAYMHESLYGAVGKRLTYVLNVGARAITKTTLNVHAGHDDYHCIDDTGFFQVFGKNAQHVCDLNIIAHRVAELALTPGIVAQDGFLTTHLIESLRIPERELIAEYLGSPEDIIDTPTPAQRIIFGDTRRRIPELWNVDNPMMVGIVQNQDAYMQSVAAQRPFFFGHVAALTDQAMEEFYRLTGRRYRRVMGYRVEDAEYLILGQGSLIPSAEVVADYLRETRGIKVGVVDLVMFRPFPGDLIGRMIKGKRGVAVLERTDQPLAEDLPLMREIRAAVAKCRENGESEGAALPYPEYERFGANDTPRLYSGSFGMGSRDLQPEGIIAAVENMLPQGKQKKMFYLSIDFIRENPLSEKQREHQEEIEKAYPGIKELALRGSENPNLMPKSSIAVRFHSVGGWGAITTGKNLAMTLFDLLGYHIKANPKYGSEKKGQPTTYYLSAAPEPIRINCEYIYVDVVLSPDPNVFAHTNALAGLKEGGVFIIQSDLESPENVWAAVPEHYRRVMIEKKIRLFYLDAFKIAREEASDAELQFRMQGNAFQGAFFAASPVMQQAGLTEEQLFKAIEEQLQHKFGTKGARIVEDNMRVVRRGFTAVHEVTDKKAEVTAATTQKAQAEKLPLMLPLQPKSKDALSDIHRFWEQTGSFYARGQGSDNITDPFIGLSIMPAVTSIFRDMTGIRFEHPEWNPEKCTGCGNCYTVCPDSALPGLVSEISHTFATALERVREQGQDCSLLSKTLPYTEQKFRELLRAKKPEQRVHDVLIRACAEVLQESQLDTAEKEKLTAQFEAFNSVLATFKLAVTKPYFSQREKKKPGEGGLFSITLNPYTCKGCMACVEQCPEDALTKAPQTKDSIAELKRNWELWLKLPTTPKKYIRVDDLEERVGALQQILLDKQAYFAIASGDGACMGCTEKTVIHLFLATIEALMQPRVAKQVKRLEELIAKLEQHIRMKLAEHMQVGTGLEQIAAASKDVSIQEIAAKLGDNEVIDRQWLARVTRTLAVLKDLQWRYIDGTTGKGRAKLGMLNSTGCTSVWGSTYPFNPYPFPWSNHLFQDSTSLAMGIFEGHMVKMAQGFKAIRQAELELNGGYDAAKYEQFFRYFSWKDFSDEEFLLCPPVVAMGGDGSMYDIGFQNLSRMMMSGKPIKVMVMDTQVYSNTGGQACTSGFTGQVSDMAQYGKAMQGKQEIRKEIGLIAMAHRTTYVLQSGICSASHLIGGFVEGLMLRRPALFNVYCACQPEHGVPDDVGARQAKLALESRAYPFFTFNPEKGEDPASCFDLEGNPAMDRDWPTYTLRYVENGVEKSMETPMTFADFALTEARFRKHFKKAPRDAWNDNMVPLADFLKLSPEARKGKYPYLWAVDRQKQLGRVLVAQPLVASCEDRLHFWHMLKSLAGLEHRAELEALEGKIRGEMMAQISAGLNELMTGGSGQQLKPFVEHQPQPANGNGAEAPAKQNGVSHEAIEPRVDSKECTACCECIFVNSEIFAFNEQRKVYLKNPKGGPYSDIVKAAEKCAAQAIHPGTPKDRSERDIEKWIERGAKFN